MRISIVCSCLTNGGAEHCASMWANGFSKQGHDVMVVTNLFESITFQLNKGIDLYNLVKNNDNKWRKWIGSIRCARHAMISFRPDVVIGVMPTCSLVAKVAVMGLHIPVVATEHNSFERPLCAPFSLWERFAKFVLNYMYEGVTVLTEADKKVVDGRFKNIKVMPNPLSLTPATDVANKNSIILAAGRLDAWHYKGFDVLIKAWGILMKNESLMNNISSKGEGNIKRWRLQLAGTGSKESLAYLKRLCVENGVEDSVDFLGFVSDMESLYKEASVFVLSSRYEGFGLVLIEAMSQGCVCVACDYNGRQREILQNDSQGLCCEPGCADALANSIKKCIDNEKNRLVVQKNAIERSKYYDIKHTMNRWEDYLNTIVNKK